MEIDRNQVPLTESEERELTAYVYQLYTLAKAQSRSGMYQKCYNAYNQIWDNELPKEWQWIQKISLYMQTMTQLVDTWESVLSNYLFSNDNKYLDVVDDETGEFWSGLLKKNNEVTGFVPESQSGIKQCLITGDNAGFILPQGNYFKTHIVPVGEIFFWPLSLDFSQVSKVHLLRKTEFELRQSQLGYFNLAKLREIPWWKFENSRRTSSVHDTHNPISSSGRDVSIGAGFLCYQAYIHYFKFDTGTWIDGTKRELTNFIVTLSNNPRVMIRFEEQGTVSPYFRNTLDTIPKGLFYGKGIIEPNLNPLSYMNTMATLGLVDKFLRVMQVYTYDSTDEILKLAILQRKMLLQPGAMIPRSKEGSLTPLQRDPSPRGEDKDHILFWKNEMQETTGATPLLSGSMDGTPDATATSSGIRAQGAQGKAVKRAKHWDEYYLKADSYRKIQLFQERFKNLDPQSLQMELANRMKSIGFNEEKITGLISDPNGKWIQSVFKPIEYEQIVPTGTTSVSNKLTTQANFNNAINGAAVTPEAQSLEWDKIAEYRLKINDVPNASEFIITRDERLQQQMQGIIQILQSNVDNNPTLPDGSPNPNVGGALQPNQIAALQSQLMSLQQQLTGEISGGQIVPSPQMIAENQFVNNPVTGLQAEDVRPTIDMPVSDLATPNQSDMMSAMNNQSMGMNPTMGNEMNNPMMGNNPMMSQQMPGQLPEPTPEELQELMFRQNGMNLPPLPMRM